MLGVTRRRLIPLLLGAGSLLSSVGCDERPAAAGADASAGQWYHAHLATDDGVAIPFFLQVPGDCESGVATILNGAERLEAECRRSPVGFVIDFPVYATQLEAWFKPDGTLTGHWCRELPTGRDPILLLKAEPVSEPDRSTRFSIASEEADTDVGGAWRVEFGQTDFAKAAFVWEESGVVTGSVEVPSSYGDLRFLAGNARGSHLRLSTFDGQHAYVFEGEVEPDGTMVGEWVTHLTRIPFVAARDEDFQIPDPLARVEFTPDVKRLDLEPLQDAKFDGKGVIVEIFGTWCPNCNDHAPVLVDLYQKYQPHGLEILGLAYEYGFDAEYKERRVREFKKRHGAEWDIVIADSTLEELAMEGLDGLSPIEGVPVTIFLNRDGTVHAVYSGFSGPATGEAHQQAEALFEKLTVEILNGL